MSQHDAGVLASWPVGWSVGPTDEEPLWSAQPTKCRYCCGILQRWSCRDCFPDSSVSPTTLESRDVAEHLLLQADLLPEVLASLVALARRSQSGRAGYVNSQIPETLTTSISRDLGVDIPRSVWLPWVDRAAREVKADPPTDSTPLLPRRSRPGPFPLESGPPEACSSH